MERHADPAAGGRIRGRLRGRSGGFTMVELIVVVVILAILAVVVIPYAVGTSELRVRSAARMLMSDLEYAQSEAIVTQAPVTVTFDVAGDSYTVSNASGPLIHPITKSAYEVRLHQSRGMSGVTIASASFGVGSVVTFDALGAPDSSGTVAVAAGAETYYVSVAPVTGRVTVVRAP